MAEIKQNIQVTPAPTLKLNQNVDKTRTYLYDTNTQKLVKSVFADGVVSEKEAQVLKENHDEIIRDFLVACELLDKMEKEPQNYSKESVDAAKFVVNRLMRAREKSYAALDKATFYNALPPAEKQRRIERQQKKEHLDINFNLFQIFALNGAAHEVIKYARAQEMSRLMTPLDVKKAEKRIMEIVNEVIEKGQDERLMLQLLKKDKERV